MQVDEIWSFCHAKAKNVPEEKRGQFGYGDVWTFTAICADTKLIPSWLVGTCDSGTATQFLNDLASRLTHRIQITSNGHRMYLEAVEDGFAHQIDHAMLQKIYGDDPDSEKRYRPAKCNGTQRIRVQGNPDSDHISTAYVERQNLSMRMSMRRLTRLTNAFSKKVENLAHAVALHFMHYNFCCIHGSLRVTPAMEAGISSTAWEVRDIVRLLEHAEGTGEIRNDANPIPSN